MTFNEHCAALGIELLKDDVIFIKRMLKTIHSSKHKAILNQYVALWLTGMVEEQSSIKKQGVGRRMANSSLLKL